MAAGRRRGVAPQETRWGFNRLDDAVAAGIVANAGVRAGDLVVDLGAGTGALTQPLVAAGARVLAVELHPGRARWLRQRFADDDVRVWVGDLQRLRYPGEPFSVVANPPWALAEAVRAGLARAPALRRADLVLARWLVRRWAQTDPRVEVGMSVRAEAFDPRAPTGAAVAVMRGNPRHRVKR